MFGLYGQQYTTGMTYILLLAVLPLFTFHFAVSIIFNIPIATDPCVPRSELPLEAESTTTSDSDAESSKFLALGSPTSTNVLTSSTLHQVFVSSSFDMSKDGHEDIYMFMVEPRRAFGQRTLSDTMGYLGPGGKISACEQASVLTLQDGKLSSDGFSMSTAHGVASEIFAASVLTGSLVTTFSIVDGSLNWSNASFDNGYARFCDSNSTITTVFQGDVPDSCIPIDLLAIRAGEKPQNDLGVAHQTDAFFKYPLHALEEAYRE